MKKIIIAFLISVLVGLAVLWGLARSGPNRPNHATLTQRQYVLGQLINEHNALRLMLDSSEQADLGLLAAYTRQLAELAAKPKDTQKHRDLVERLSQAIANKINQIEGVQKRRSAELAPLAQRIHVLVQHLTDPAT